jgi:antitoxin component of RelBE/YafQ-DinJ toxin-antitoxin module
MSEDYQADTAPAIKLRVESSFKAEIEEAAKEMHLSVSAFTRLALAELIRQRNANAKEAV